MTSAHHLKNLDGIIGGDREPILIAGAGIAGLTLALSLARHGLSVRILEKSPELRTDGGGIQLAPNAVNLLTGLGVLEKLKETAIAPNEIVIRSGKSGRVHARLPLGHDIERRHGAPYLVTHRINLQDTLQDALNTYRNLVDIEYGAGLESYHQSENRVGVITTTGKTYYGSALIGADGLHSRVRRQMMSNAQPCFSGYVAWRGLVDITHSPMPLQNDTVNLWLGSKAHVTAYPIIRNKTVNVVAVVEGLEQQTNEEREQSFNEQNPCFLDWHEDACTLLGRVCSWRRWPLSDRPPTRPWSEQKVVLIGDAAHPTLPFLAQGGAMSIEDAVSLSCYIAHANDDYNLAFKQFEETRYRRTAQIQTRSRLQGLIYHLPHPLSVLRNAFMYAKGNTGMLERYDWIHSWHPFFHSLPDKQ